jgi:hypothetical protein
MGLDQILLLAAFILFTLEAFMHRNLIAGGLALCVLTVLV